MSYHKKILVVCSNCTTTQIIKEVIRGYYGKADIYTACDGNHAKKIFDDYNSEVSPFELVITQFSTGETGGLALAEYISRRGVRHCRTIIYTSKPKAMMPPEYTNSALHVHKNMFNRSTLGNMFSAIEDSDAA